MGEKRKEKLLFCDVGSNGEDTDESGKGYCYRFWWSV